MSSARLMRRLLACALVLGSTARAQATPVLLASGAGVSAGKGGGARPVLFRSGWYFAFFFDGTQLVYRASDDGFTFTTPVPASAGIKADLGFSVANAGDRVALVWGTQGAAQSELWFREGTISGSTITWRGAQLISASATALRGYFPLVAFDSNGVPVLNAFHQNQAYAGPLPGPCGSPSSYRPAPHVALRTLADGGASFFPIGYCTELSNARDPISLSLAPTSTPLVVHAALMNGNLVTGLINGSVDGGNAELGETTLRSDATTSNGGQLCSASDFSVATDVHHVYQTAAGAIAYARQDGTRDAGTGLGYDVATVAAAGSWPYLAQPSDGGCHTIAWAEGSFIQTRHFQGGVDAGAGLSTPLSAFAASTTPAALAGQASAANEPAVLWQEGSSLYFGVLPATGAAPVSVVADPAGPADGTTFVIAGMGQFSDSCGDRLVDQPVTLSTSLGTIDETDDDPVAPGLQRQLGPGGQVIFRLRSSAPGIATVVGIPVQGGRAARLPVRFYGPPAQLTFTSPPQQLTAGQCSASLTVEMQDDGGVTSPATADTTVALTGFPSFFDDWVVGCPGTPIGEVVLRKDGTTISFRLREPVAGRYPVTASAPGLTSAVQEVLVVPDVPAALAFASGPFTVDAGECSPAVAFGVIDRFGNASPPAAGLVVSAGAGLADGGRTDAQLYADPGCSTPFSPVTISAPDSGAALYFRGFVPESFTLSLSTNGLTGASQMEAVRSASAALRLDLRGDAGFTGSELIVHAEVTNTGIENLTGVRLYLDAQGLALSTAGPRTLSALPAGATVNLDEAGTVTAAAGAEVVVRGRLETSSGESLGPEVTLRRTVTPMVADLGGCGGCSAGGTSVAAAGAAFALLLLARRRRRVTARSWCPRSPA